MSEDFAIRVIIDPGKAQSGEAKVRRSLKNLEGDAKKLEQAIEKSTAPLQNLRINIARESLNQTTTRINGVTNQVDRLKRGLDSINTVKLSGVQGQVKALRGSIAGLRGDAEALRQAMAQSSAPVQNIRLGAARQDLNRATTQIKGVSSQVDALRRNIENANRVKLTGLNSALNTVRQSASRAVAGIKRVGVSLTELGAKARTTSVELGTVQQVIAALAAGAAVRQVVRLGSGFEQLERRIGSVSRGSGDAQRNMELVKQVSDETGTSLEQNARVFVRLSVATRNLGISSERTAGVLKTLNQGLILGGAATSEAAAATTQLGQALASGRLQGDELRSLLENAPILAEQLASQLGVTIGELRELGATGQLTSDRLISGLEGAAGVIDQRFKELGPSFEQSMQRLSNAFLELGQSFGPFISNLSQAVDLMTALVGPVSEVGSRIAAGSVQPGNAAGAAASGATSQTLVDELYRNMTTALLATPFTAPIGLGLKAAEGPRTDFAAESSKQTSGQQFEQESTRLFNLADLREGSENVAEINGRLATFRGLLKEAGLGAQDISLINTQSRDVKESVEDLRGALGRFGVDLDKVGQGTKDFVGPVQDLVGGQEQVAAASDEAAAAIVRQEVEQRRLSRALTNQLSKLQSESEAIGQSRVERETQAQVLRAEQTLRRANISATSEQAQAQIKEVETLARANAERREAIRVAKEQADAEKRVKKAKNKKIAADDKRERNQQLRLRKKLLDDLRTPEEERAALQSDVNQLLLEGVINQEEFNRLQSELPELLEGSAKQMKNFTDEMQKANKQAQDLGTQMGQILVGGVGRASDAIADFVVNGLQDFDSFKSALGDIFKDIAKQILAAIIKALILRALLGEGGGGSGGGILGLAGLNGTAARRHGGGVNSGRGYTVGEGGAREMFISNSSPGFQRMSAGRSRSRTSGSAGVTAGRQFGGGVSSGATLLGPGVFQPPSDGLVLNAAQTSAALNSKQQSQPIVVSPPEVVVNVTTPPVQVGGRVIKEALREDSEAQGAVVEIMNNNSIANQQGR